MGKYDVNAINLKVYDVTPIHGGIILRWTSSLGFGEYTIFTSDLKDEEGDRKWVAMSEHMDRGEELTDLTETIAYDHHYNNALESRIRPQQ